jgi:hypothetical protein
MADCHFYADTTSLNLKRVVSLYPLSYAYEVSVKNEEFDTSQQNVSPSVASTTSVIPCERL